MKTQKLLEDSLENYRLLKEQYLFLQEENQNIRSDLDQELKEIEDDKLKLYNDIDEFQNYTSVLSAEMEAEKLKREQLFQEFQSSTLQEVQCLYQKQLEQLTLELTKFDEQATETSAENERLSTTLDEANRHLETFEAAQKSAEREIKREYELEIKKLCQQLHEQAIANENVQKLQKELELEQLEVASLKDEKSQLMKQVQAIASEKDGEIRKVSEEMFKISQEKTDFEMKLQRLSAENTSLKLNVCSALEREKELQMKLSQSEREKMESISKLKKNEVAKEAEFVATISRLELQIKNVTNKMQDYEEDMRRLRKANTELKNVLAGHDQVVQKYETTVTNYRNQIHNLELAFQDQRQNYDKKIHEIAFDKSYAEQKIGVVISKSNAGHYLAEIDKLNSLIEEKDNEIVKLKSHYRSLLSKMKRALENYESR